MTWSATFSSDDLPQDFGAPTDSSFAYLGHFLATRPIQENFSFSLTNETIEESRKSATIARNQSNQNVCFKSAKNGATISKTKDYRKYYSVLQIRPYDAGISPQWGILHKRNFLENLFVTETLYLVTLAVH